jgi:hypothetical protein
MFRDVTNDAYRLFLIIAKVIGKMNRISPPLKSGYSIDASSGRPIHQEHASISSIEQNTVPPQESTVVRPPIRQVLLVLGPNQEIYQQIPPGENQTFYQQLQSRNADQCTVNFVGDGKQNITLDMLESKLKELQAGQHTAVVLNLHSVWDEARQQFFLEFADNVLIPVEDVVRLLIAYGIKEITIASCHTGKAMEGLTSTLDENWQSQRQQKLQEALQHVITLVLKEEKDLEETGQYSKETEVSH